MGQGSKVAMGSHAKQVASPPSSIMLMAAMHQHLFRNLAID
jgi:hypothetical protein